MCVAEWVWLGGCGEVGLISGLVRADYKWPVCVCELGGRYLLIRWTTPSVHRHQMRDSHHSTQTGDHTLRVQMTVMMMIVMTRLDM